MSKQVMQKISPIIGTVGKKHKVYNWHGYKILIGQGKSAFILDEIQHRRKKVKQNMIIVVGQPGEGKSYFALRLCEILDPRFNPNQQIVLERSHLLWLLGPNSPLKRGQPILIDEAQFIAGARHWYEDVQKDVMDHIEAIRSKGFIVIIVALHLNLLDKIIRKYVLNMMMLMMERGRAAIYRLYTPPFIDRLYHPRIGKMALQLPSYEQCKYPNCLICKHMEKCMTNRAVYERIKRDFLNKMSLGSQQKAVADDQKKRIIDYNDTLKKVIQYKDDFVYMNSGKVEPESVKLILEDKFSLIINDAEANRLIRRGAIRYPDIFKLKKREEEF